MCRESIAKEFVRSVDMVPIARHCKDHNLAVSFRKAGQYTLIQLDNGAAAKGHNILAKSIKEESVREHFTDIPENIRGLVGYWEDVTDDSTELFIGNRRDGKTPVLKGIYITQFYNDNKSGNTISHKAKARQNITFDDSSGDTGAGGSAITVDDFIKSVVKEDKVREALSVGVAEGNPALKNMTKLSYFIEMYNDKKEWHFNPRIENIYSCFYTGDYDLHDIIQFTDTSAGSKGRRIEKTDFAIVRNLASDISNNASYGRPKSMEFNVIRHGPQCGYFCYAINRLEGIVPGLSLGLLRADLPVAMCNRGVWSIISQWEDLKTFYETNVGQDIHVVWMSDGNEGKFVPKLERYIAIKSLAKGIVGDDTILAKIEAELVKLKAEIKRIKLPESDQQG